MTLAQKTGAQVAWDLLRMTNPFYGFFRCFCCLDCQAVRRMGNVDLKSFAAFLLATQAMDQLPEFHPPPSLARISPSVFANEGGG